MNKLLIYSYINKLKYNDLINYCNNNGIQINDSDTRIIYSYIKNDYRRFFENPDKVLNEVKNKVSDNTFSIIMNLYKKYKKYI